MIKCPHCGEQAMTPLRKTLLGPAQSTGCKRCGGRISVSAAAFFALIPFLLSMILANSLADRGWLLIGGSLAAGFLAMVYIHVTFIPLVPRDE
ncbi:hypothetical protein [uncultured Gilvimarinus sp.]|uniref:hypothetical protein n=1 Tax=uncultured Gilvimarinus sp. TaxID=1689143 RepID=UPI0030DDAF9C